MTVPDARSTYGGGEQTKSETSRQYTLVYDGACKVCGRFVRVVQRWDRHRLVETVPFQQAGVAARFPWIPMEAYNEAMQLVGPGGQTWQGAPAIEKLLDVLPRGWVVGWLFKLPLVGKLADRVYRWFARNRYRLGCADHCQYRT